MRTRQSLDNDILRELWSNCLSDLMAVLQQIDALKLCANDPAEEDAQKKTDISSAAGKQRKIMLHVMTYESEPETELSRLSCTF